MSATKAAFHVGIGTVAKLGGALVSIKIIALYLGPQGLGVLGNFMSVVAMFNVLACGGVSLGVTRYVAQFRHNPDPAELRKVLQTSSGLVVVSCLALAFVTAMFAERLSFILFKSGQYVHVLRNGCLLLLPIGYSALGLAVLNGLSATSGLALVQIGAALLGSGGLFALVYFWQEHGAAVGLLWINACAVCCLGCWLAKNKDIHMSYFIPVLDKSTSLLLLRYSVMMLVTVACQNFAQIEIRGWIQKDHGWEEVGFWQAMVRTSDAYLQIFNAFLVAYLLPRLSQQGDPKKALGIIFATYRFILPLLLFVLAVVFFTRDIIIHLLLSQNFEPMRDLFFPQMVADFFKILAFLPGYLVIARGNLPLLLLVDPVQIILLLLLSSYFIKQGGAAGACKASALAYAVYLTISICCLIAYKYRSKSDYQ